MDWTPRFEITRFEQLQPGDLFIFEIEGVSCVGLKAIDHHNDGDCYIVPLGPNFPTNHGPAQFISWKPTTVVSFGKNFTIQLPTEPSGWTTAHPSKATLPLVVRNGELYARANYSYQEGDFKPCLVRLDDGSVLYSWNSSIFAFAVHWKIVTVGETPTQRLILEVGSK